MNRDHFSVGFPDWERMAVTDWLMDFAGMDLHRPLFKIPEKLYAYLQEKGIEVERPYREIPGIVNC